MGGVEVWIEVAGQNVDVPFKTYVKFRALHPFNGKKMSIHNESRAPVNSLSFLRSRSFPIVIPVDFVVASHLADL